MAINPITGEEEDEYTSVTNKYNTDRQALEDSQSGYDTQGALAGALASLGAAFQGKDSLGAVSQMQNQRRQVRADEMSALDKWKNSQIENIKAKREGKTAAREDAVLAREDDPNSNESKMANELAGAMGYKGVPITATQFKSFSPIMEKKYEIEQKRIESQRSRADKHKEGLTAGRIQADKDYGKDYNDFTGGGEVKAQDAIEKLKSFKKQMSVDNGLFQAGGGPISGSLPDMLRTQSSIAQRDNIVSTANSALKATFGGQLSDGERKALANEFYNDKLSNAENLKIIDQKIKELENGLGVQRNKASHFRNVGTLTGLEAPKKIVKKFKGSNGSTKVVYSDGTEKIIPATAGM